MGVSGATSVWKYEIEVDETFTREMPEHARVLHVGVQAGTPCMWVQVAPGNKIETRTFHCHGTGHSIPLGRVHLGSFMLLDGAFVGHLFEPDAIARRG